MTFDTALALIHSYVAKRNDVKSGKAPDIPCRYVQQREIDGKRSNQPKVVQELQEPQTAPAMETHKDEKVNLAEENESCSLDDWSAVTEQVFENQEILDRLKSNLPPCIPLGYRNLLVEHEFHPNKKQMDSGDDFLSENLASFNLNRVSIRGDGNCLFASVTHQLQTKQCKFSKVFAEHLSESKLRNADGEFDSNLLRIASVEEMCRYPDKYKKYLEGSEELTLHDYR